MNGPEFYEIRKRLHMSAREFGRQLGYTGTARNVDTLIRRFERGEKQIPLYIARLAWLMDSIYGDVDMNPPETWPDCVDPDSGKIDWPEWPGYDGDQEKKEAQDA